MSTHQPSARRWSTQTGTILGAFALAAAVLVVAGQASSLKSTDVGLQVPRVPAQTAPTADPDLGMSSHTPKGCWRRKFGCGHGEATIANPDPRTSSHTPKGCWRRRLGCGQGAKTMVKRP